MTFGHFILFKVLSLPLLKYPPITVQSNIEPNAGTLLSNTISDAEKLALYESSRQGAYTLTRQTANVFIQLPLGNATSKYASIVNLARFEDPASFLPSSTDSLSLQVTSRSETSSLRNTASSARPSAASAGTLA